MSSEDQTPSAPSTTSSENKQEDNKNETPESTPHRTMSVDVDNSVEQIRKYIAKKLGFLDSEEDSAQSLSVKVLNETSVDGIIEYIKNSNSKNIITLAGAGISTAAGIPDFRSPGSGLYHNLEKYKLPHPQAVFELDYFEDNPRPFFTLAKELYPGTFKPTISHYFIRLLHEKGLLLRHYTQNIDTLERVAGIPIEKLVEAHGSFNTGHCLKCRSIYTQEWMKDKIFQDKIPTCPKCMGIVKPDIVFFGENLPEKFYDCMHQDFKQCDLLIILGSSLVVQPFASLIDRVSNKCPRLLINREKAGNRDRIKRMLNIAGGFDFDGETNCRDVAWLGDCDEGCQLLADKLDWGDELKALHKQEHEKIDKKHNDPKQTTTSEPHQDPKVE